MKISLLSTAILFGAATSFTQPQPPMTLQQEVDAWVNGGLIPAYSGGVPGLIWPHPALADIDGDGDYDLFVGTGNGRISFFENQGGSTQAHFVFITANYDNINVGSSAAPAFYDIDADGDLDLFVGNGYNGCNGGTVYFYENTGNAGTAAWTLQTTTLANIDVCDFSVPTLGDVDGDGDGDLVVGGGYGGLYFSINTGSDSNPIWASPISPYPGISGVGFKATPHLADFNCDGKVDLLIGNDTGKLYFYKNIGVSNGVVQWSFVTNILTGVDFTHLDYTSPACADLDGDGDLDILLSEHYGNINLFENISNGTCATNQWNWTTGDLLSGTIDVGQEAFPVYVDIDNDCDLDLFIGKANGKIRFYRNEGTTEQGNWVLETEFFLGFDTGGTWTNPAKLVFTDFDFDGDFDLVIAGNGTRYFENMGSADSSSFQLAVANNFLPGYLSANQSPVFLDFNGDSLMDYALPQFANSQQSVLLYLNTGQAGAPWAAQPSDTIVAGGITGQFFQALDYDLDGDSDLIFFTLSGGDAIQLLRNNGNSWTLEQLLVQDFPGGITSAFWADIDQDYDLDLVIGTTNGGILQWENTSNWASADFAWVANLLSVQFNDSSFQANEWEWDFGDGTFSSEQNPLHTYTTPGNYEVCLTAKNGCKSLSICKTVSTCSLPVAQFDTVSNQLVVQFTDLSFQANSWQWDFGDGTSSTEPAPEHTFPAPGEYEVCLLVENLCGAHDTCLSIMVCSPPVPDFDFSVQNFTSVSFENTSVWADSLYWDFGDGQYSTETNPIHTYAGDGTYPVTLTAINACDTMTLETLLTIVTPPVAGFSADNTQGCSPLVVQFANQSTSNSNTFHWSFPGGTPATSIEANPVVTYSTPGIYPVSLFVENTAGNNSVTQTGYIMVNGLPDAGFTASVNGASVSFSNASVNASSYAWDFGDGSGSMEISPNHIFPADGVYSVSLTATNDCGSTSWEEQIVIATPPVAGFSTSSLGGCLPLTVQFFSQSSSNTVIFSWQFPGGSPAFSNEQNPIVTYSTEGLFDVLLVVINPQGSDTLVFTSFIEVQALAWADFDFLSDSETVSFITTASNATSYHWDFGDGQSSMETDPVHAYQMPGIFNVTLTVSNGCSAYSLQKAVFVDFVGVDEAGSLKSLSVFPNPNNGRFTILAEGKPCPFAKVSVFTVAGQLVVSSEADFKQGVLAQQFDLSSAPIGAYWVVFHADEKAGVCKVIRQ